MASVPASAPPGGGSPVSALSAGASMNTSTWTRCSNTAPTSCTRPPTCWHHFTIPGTATGAPARLLIRNVAPVPGWMKDVWKNPTPSAPRSRGTTEKTAAPDARSRRTRSVNDSGRATRFCFLLSGPACARRVRAIIESSCSESRRPDTFALLLASPMPRSPVRGMSRPRCALTSSPPYPWIGRKFRAPAQPPETNPWLSRTCGRDAARGAPRLTGYDPPMVPRRKTRQIQVGNARTGIVKIGGGLPDSNGLPSEPAPVSVQTMTAGYTHDIDACVAEINRLHQAGADIVRVAVPEKKDTDALREILKQTRVPIVA